MNGGRLGTPLVQSVSSTSPLLAIANLRPRIATIFPLCALATAKQCDRDVERLWLYVWVVTVMVTWERIEELEQFDSAGAPVLSLYMDLNPALQPTWLYRAELKDLVEEISGGLDEPARSALAGEVDRVSGWLEWLPEESRPEMGLALFACTPRGLWWAEIVPTRVGHHLTFGVRPDIADLLPLVEERDLADRRRAA
jgi:hypothetical protein